MTDGESGAPNRSDALRDAEALAPPEMARVLAAAGASPEASCDFVSVIAGTLSLREFLDPRDVERILEVPMPTAVTSSGTSPRHPRGGRQRQHR